MKPDDFSILIEAKAEAEAERGDTDTGTKVDQGKIRKTIIDQLHLHMDAAIEERIQRIEPSQLQKSTPTDSVI